MELRVEKIGKGEQVTSELLAKLKAMPWGGRGTLIGHVLWDEYQSAVFYFESGKWYVLIAKKRPPLRFVENLPDIEGAEVTKGGLARTMVLLSDNGLRACLKRLAEFFGEPMDINALNQVTVAQYLRNVFNL